MGCDDRAVHEARLQSDPACRYLNIESGTGEQAGFAILCGIEPLNRCVELKRIAVANPGSGVGREALRQLIALAFGEWNAHRLWLDVYDDNERARRSYRALGFEEEGTLRECIWHGGRFRSLVVMAMLNASRGG